jgi:hypothetical protein
MQHSLDCEEPQVSSTACVNVGGYSLHAATAVKSSERDRLEKLVRYMARPAIAEERLAILPNGDIKLKLKTPCRKRLTTQGMSTLSHNSF